MCLALLVRQQLTPAVFGGAEGAMKTMSKRLLDGFALLLVSALVLGCGPRGENPYR